MANNLRILWEEYEIWNSKKGGKYVIHKNMNLPFYSSLTFQFHNKKLSKTQRDGEREPQTKQRTFHGRPNPGDGNYHHRRLYNVVVFLNFLNFDFIFSSIKYKWRFEIEK